MPAPDHFTVDPSVESYLDALYASDRSAAERIDDLLDALGADYTDPRVRARAWDPGAGKWGFDVKGRDVHTVLWLVEAVDDEVHVFVPQVITNL